MDSLSIRYATDADEDEIDRIHNTAIQESSDYTEDQREALIFFDTVPDRLTDSDTNTTFIAEIEGQVVGWCSINKEKSVIDGLFVDPEYQGQGIGTRLCTRMEDCAAENDMEELYVICMPSVALFYTTLGYSIISEGKQFQTLSGESVECSVLRKII